MLYAFVQSFDMIKNIEKFWELKKALIWFTRPIIPSDMAPRK